MKKIHILTALLLASAMVISSGALAIRWRHPPNADTPANKDAIYTAVFQHMMAHRQRPYTGISVGGDDPDATIMRQFASSKGVVPGSRITITNAVFVDGKTGWSAEQFGVHPTTLEWSGPFHASIDAGAHGSPLDGYEGTYDLVRTGGHWKVDRYRDSGLMF